MNPDVAKTTGITELQAGLHSYDDDVYQKAGDPLHRDKSNAITDRLLWQKRSLIFNELNKNFTVVFYERRTSGLQRRYIYIHDSLTSEYHDCAF